MKKNKLSKLKICGHDYKISFHKKIENDEGLDLWGQCRMKDQKIKLKLGTHKQLTEENLIHEVLHAIDGYRKGSLSESAICHFSNAFQQLGVGKFLFNKIKK